jgi:hypothetical protein
MFTLFWLLCGLLTMLIFPLWANASLGLGDRVIALICGPLGLICLLWLVLSEAIHGGTK